jgi:hypothetical protein
VGTGGLEQVDRSNMIVLVYYLVDLLSPYSVGPVGPLYIRISPYHRTASS